MSCSRWNPWQYDPRDPRYVLSQNGVGFLPLLPDGKPTGGVNLDAPAPNTRRPPQDMPPATEPPADETPPAGTDTARPDVATLAIVAGVALLLGSMLAGARGFGGAMGGMGA